MANHGCINGKLDDGKYSSPMPAIGLYIAAASLVCFLAMLFDIISGFRRRKPWIPCRLFSLNSVTLTLLSIAAKLPVDLTTPMPGSHDQFSKLSGTILLCVSICFLMPSLGSNSKSEGLTNLVALSILLVTVVVNICLQIRTGVIFFFVAEHIAVMYFMVALLMALWIAYHYDVDKLKDVSLDLNKDLIRKGPGSMLQRLKLCYVYGFNYDPQLGLCLNGYSFVYVGVSFVCLVIIVSAAFRSFNLQQLINCGDTSDYKWSMWIIIATQLVTIVVASFGTCLRGIVSSGKERLYSRIMGQGEWDARDVRRSNRFLGSDWRDNCVDVLEPVGVSVACVVLIPIYVCLVIPYLILEGLFKRLFKHREIQMNTDMDEYIHLIHEGDMGLQKWTLQKCVENMKRWMYVNYHKSYHLPRLLLKTPPSQQLHPMELKDHDHPDQQGIEVSSLSMAILVRIAEVSIPSKFSAPIVKTFSEVHEIVHFIESRVNPASFKNERKYKLARAVRIGRDFNSISDTRTAISGRLETEWDLDDALRIISELKTNASPSNLLWDQIGLITKFIRRRSHSYSSIEDLYNCIEQMFVDMLHNVLSQLPHALYKEITESPAEEFEERSRRALEILYRVESSEAQIQWSFPAGCNISRLITPEVQDHHRQHNANASIRVTQNSGINALANNADVRLQV